MFHNKKILGGVAITAALALSLGACSDPTTSKESASGPQDWPAATTKLDGVELKMWAAQSSSQIPKQVIADFEKSTGAKVKVETIPDPYEHGVQTKVATGDKPDLAFWQPTASQLLVLNAKENLQPLDGAPWVENYTGGMGDITGKLDDTRYAALVSSPSAMGVFYNKQVFADNGITEVPQSWDELMETAKKLKAAGVAPFFDFGMEWWASQWAVQVQVADAAKDGLWDKINRNEEKFTGPALQTAVDNYQKMIDEDLFNDDLKTATFDDQAVALLEGKAAMAIQVNSLAESIMGISSAKELDEKIGFFPISEKGHTPTFHPDQTNALVAFKTGDAKQEAAARQFLTFWMQDGYENFIKDRGLPSIMKDVQTPAEVPQLMSDLAASLEGATGSMQAQAIVNPDLAMNLGDMIAGTKTPVEVTTATQSQFEKLAKASGAENF